MAGNVILFFECRQLRTLMKTGVYYTIERMAWTDYVRTNAVNEIVKWAGRRGYHEKFF